MNLMNDMNPDPNLTAPLDAVPLSASQSKNFANPDHDQEPPRRSNLNDPRRILPPQTHKAASLWKKLIALVGLGAFSILGGLIMTLIVGLLAIAAALILQAAIS